MFLAIGSAFVTALMPSAGVCLDGAATAALRPFQPEALLALMLWRFVEGFPVDTQPGAAERRVSVAFVNVSFGVGAVLFTANALGGLCGWAVPAWLTSKLGLLDRDDPYSIYWLLLFATAAPAIPFLVWKARLATYENRRRVMVFVGALTAGLTPFVLAVVATPFVPALWDASVRHDIGIVLYAALALIVPVTAYAVAVDRVMDVQFLVGRALKYALARYAVWAVSLGPIAYVGFDIYMNQQLTIAQYVERSRPVGPLALSALGLVTLTLRHHLLSAIDRWFLVDPFDQSQTLARLERRCRRAGSVRDVTQALATELERAMRAPVAVLVVNSDGTELVPVEGTAGPIRRDSTLVEVLRSTRADVPLDSHVLTSLVSNA